MSAECRYLRSLLAEYREIVADVILGVAFAGAVNDVERRLRSIVPHDPGAERIVLGACLRTGLAVDLDLFAVGHHRALAVAIGTGMLAEELLGPEAVGYRRGLMRRRRGLLELRDATETLLSLRAQRRALAAAERAVAALRRWDGGDEGSVALREALRAMG